jgi:hypothetical protein
MFVPRLMTERRGELRLHLPTIEGPSYRLFDSQHSLEIEGSTYHRPLEHSPHQRWATRPASEAILALPGVFKLKDNQLRCRQASLPSKRGGAGAISRAAAFLQDAHLPCQPSAVAARVVIDPDDALFIKNERCVEFPSLLGRDS